MSSIFSFLYSCCAPKPEVRDSGAFKRVAVVGTPNCGKTALFNALTGSKQRVANYSGVTVERKEGIFTPHIHLIDLPGTISLVAHSPDEEITRDVILARRADEAPMDAILCVGDATNLKPTLRLVMELKSVGLPILLVVNMMDVADAHGHQMNLQKLANALGVPVTSSVAVRKGGTALTAQALNDLMDKLAASDIVSRPNPHWAEPSTPQLREWSQKADQILTSVLVANRSPSALSNKIDNIVLHPMWGLLVLLGVLFAMFQALFAWATPVMDLMKSGFDGLGELAKTQVSNPLLQSFITDGLIGGVGGVLVFLPQILLLFIFIILLEDFGYMARAAFLMDRVMGKTGLHGRAFIPLLCSVACASPGIMASRTIANPKDRITTILVAPFMPCSARLPVYTLVISAMIPNTTLWGFVGLQGLVMFCLFAVGIMTGLFMAFVFKRGIFKGVMEPLLLSLPNYKIPNWQSVFFGIWQRAMMFLKRAGTIILFVSILLWAALTFPMQASGLVEIGKSYAGMLGQFLAPIMKPIGFSWEMTLSLIPAMAAREVAVATLGTIYAIGSHATEASEALGAALHAKWSLASALSYLTWFIFAPQCFSTLVVVKNETGKWKWPLFMFTYMMAMAYVASFIVYHIAAALLNS